MSARPAALLLALLAAAACRKAPGPPSAEYQQARSLRVALLARYADDADARPEADEVLALLDRVAPDSVDAAAAAELKGRILAARKRLQAEAAERERLVAEAAVPPALPAAAAGGAGADPRPRPRLAPGLPLDVFRSAYEDCFESRTRLEIRDADGGVLDAQGEAWQLRDDPACRERYPGLVDQVILFGGGVLVSARPSSAIVRVEVRQTVEFLPDGGYRPIAGPPGDGGPP